MLFQAINLRLIGEDRRHLVTHHAQREQTKQDCLHNQEDDHHVVIEHIARKLSRCTTDVFTRHQYDGIQTCHKHPKDEQNKQFVSANSHTIIGPSISKHTQTYTSISNTT